MAFDSQTVVSNGSLTSLAITLDYLSRDEISVSYDDVNIPAGSGQWGWVGTVSKTMTFTPSPANGVVVKVQRTTQLASMYHKFSEGAQFLPKILDENFDQLLHLVQEGGGGGGGVAGVTSFNTRTGDVTLDSDDVIDALGYVPAESGSGGGGDSTFQVVNNVAAVRLLNATIVKTAQTKGYYETGDGGESTYYYDAADVSSVDDGGAVIVGAAGARWKLAQDIIVSAKQYGARGNSSYSVPGSDDTARLQAWVNYLSQTGGEGFLPQGRYRTTQRIIIPNTCTIRGTGWKDVRDMTGPVTRNWAQSQVVGSIIYTDFTNTDVDHSSAFYLTGNTVTISDMEFETLQPLPGPAWVSNNTPYAIHAFGENFYEQAGHGPVLTNLMLRNHKDGIYLHHVFRGHLDRIYGQCFGKCIEVNESADVCRIENVQINWSFYTGDATANTYMFNNAIGLQLGRVDNPIITNFFIWGGSVGIKTYVNTHPNLAGKTSRAQLTNIGLDNITTGVLINDAVDLSINNFYVFNNLSQSNTRGIWSTQVLGGGQTPARIQLTNGDFQGSTREAIRLEVPGDTTLANITIRDYNSAPGGVSPGIAAYSGVRVQYANLVVDNVSPGAPPTQAFDTGTISGGAGGGGGVSSFNTRTGAVTLLEADLTAAAGSALAKLSGAAFTGAVGVNSTIRSTGTTTPASGKGVEINYNTSLDAGFVNSYDQTAAQYKDLNIGGRTITWKAGTSGANAGFLDTGGRFIFGYGTDQGGYKLQVNGSTLLGGPAFAFTPSTGTTGTQVTTCDYVINRIALGNYASLAGASFTGAVTASSTLRSTGTTTPVSGSGVEINYDTGLDAGFINSFNHTSSVYKDLNIGGSRLTFKSGAGANNMLLDTAGSLLVGYGVTNGATYKLQVNSQIFATSATIATSDRKVKENIKPLESGLDAVLALRPRTYTFRKHDVHNFPEGVQVGFIAQEVEATLAQTDYVGSVVTSLDAGGDVLANLKGLAEVKIVPLLVKAIQELHAEVQALKAKE